MANPRCSLGCYRASLDLAETHGLHAVAFPGISTGVYGFPIELAVDVATQSVRDWAAETTRSMQSVIFCCFSERDLALYERALGHRPGGIGV